MSDSLSFTEEQAERIIHTYLKEEYNIEKRYALREQLVKQVMEGLDIYRLNPCPAECFEDNREYFGEEPNLTLDAFIQKERC